MASANLVFLPIATKLKAQARREAQRREIMLEGILAILEGMNPRLIDQKLRGFTLTERASSSPLLDARAA